MKLLSFYAQGEAQLGWLQEDEQTVLSVDPDDEWMPHSVLDLIKRGSYARQQIATSKDLQEHQLSDLYLLEPVIPESMFCIGLNYHDHAKESGVEAPEYPTVFWRLARNNVPHGQPLWVPTCSNSLDWEGELAVVIGKNGRNITPECALEHVFGYTIFNDGSVREYQQHTSQFGLGKNFQGTGSLGPLIVTADEFGDPDQHTITTSVNGEQVQHSSISQMIHKVEELIVYLSSAMVVKAGDIICTGTPAGVGAGQDPSRFLQDGEEVEITISGIGTLTNPIRLEPTDLNALACNC